jgi:hypothetical protein
LPLHSLLSYGNGGIGEQTTREGVAPRPTLSFLLILVFPLQPVSFPLLTTVRLKCNNERSNRNNSKCLQRFLLTPNLCKSFRGPWHSQVTYP